MHSCARPPNISFFKCEVHVNGMRERKNKDAKPPTVGSGVDGMGSSASVVAVIMGCDENPPMQPQRRPTIRSASWGSEVSDLAVS